MKGNELVEKGEECPIVAGSGYINGLDADEVRNINLSEKRVGLSVEIKSEEEFELVAAYLLEKNYIFAGLDLGGKGTIFLPKEVDEISDLKNLWNAQRDFLANDNHLKYQVRYQKKLKKKAYDELKMIKRSRAFKVATRASSAYRKINKINSYPILVLGKASSIFSYFVAKRKINKYKSFVEKILPHLEHYSTGREKADFIEKWIDGKKEKSRKKELRECYWLLKENHPEATCYIGWALWRKIQEDRYLANSVRAQLTFLGKMYDSRDFLEELDKSDLNETGKKSSYRIDDEIDKLEKGFSLPARATQAVYPKEKSVIYLLHNSLPYNSGGYATRTHGLLKGINNINEFNVYALSRPGYPSDHQKYISQKLPETIPIYDVVDNVTYYRSDQKVRKSSLTISAYVKVFSDQVKKLSIEKSASVIHAASNFPNAYAAILAARELGIKSVYEVRGLWEITRLSRQPGWDATEQFKYMAKMEANACIEADAVITITHALKNLMISRGVSAEKITVVPNCVHTELFSPISKDENLAKKLGIRIDDVVIGYIGSIVNYEGLDDLIDAVRILLEKKVSGFRVLIVGDGAVLPELKEKVKKFNLNGVVVITGRVPHSEVQSYYSLVDIAPFPRKPYDVCEMVSPLKPFEAMASSKAVLVSSCDALTEIVEDQVTGLVFKKGSTEELAKKLEEMIMDRELREQLGSNARQWVCANRDWRNGAEVVTDVYQRLLT
ncbi:glycosyltransferase family 4 protein [Halomonas sp. E14]|uniref:glycosyltransferase family 4 protein n=1 Tax=Halomonas sp. E14 TaxID=3397245 RepID=UPI00403E5919